MNQRIMFSGHTMGAPGKDIYECIRMFHRIGYDGLEVRVAQNGQINSETITDEEAGNIASFARENGMQFSCLTSYYQNFASPETRESVILNLKRVVEIADILNCPLVRLYGGTDANTLPGMWFTDIWTRTVTGIREVALFAARFGIRLCIETHVGSLTMSVRDTVRMIQDVNMSNVGILFDYAWVELAGVERGADAVRAAAPYLFHVHIKDWKLEDRCPPKKRSCLMGEGTVLWEEVLATLKEIGYTGWITDEYEKYWYPEDLPEPEIGMKHNLDYVKARIL